MFSPSPADVRRFFCATFAKSRAGQPMQAIEQLAAGWIAEHPEYFSELADVDRAVEQLATATTSPATNAFLHLSMHLSISEQCSIDQPRGIRQAVELLTARRGDLHQAQHEVMEALGQMVWDAQRAGRAPDGAAYVDAVQRRATRD